jgi:hypothetical protein
LSHSLQLLSSDSWQSAQLTIINYVVGGESVLPSELDASTIDGVIFAEVPPGQNSLNALLFPVLNAGKIMLFRFVAGVPTEIPATSALNAIITALVHVKGWTAAAT